MRWGVVMGGIAAVVAVALVCMLIISTDAPPNHSTNGVWAFFLIVPIALPIAGAIVLGGARAEAEADE